MIYTGSVREVRERGGRSAKGPWTLYTIVLDTDNGEVLIGAGFDRPNVNVGSVISIEANTNAKGYLDGNLNSIRLVRANSPTPAASNVAAPVIGNDQRQRSIVSQSAYKTAADVLGVAIAAGALKLPAAKNAASNQLDVLLGAMDEIAQHVFNKTFEGLMVTEDTPNPGVDEGEYDPTS